MLTPGCQKEGFRGFWIEAENPVGQSLGIEQFVGVIDTFPVDDVRIASVLFIETTYRLGKSGVYFTAFRLADWVCVGLAAAGSRPPDRCRYTGRHRGLRRWPIQR